MTDIATLSADVSAASALVTPFGAHLLSWRPTGYSDVLWLSSRAVLDGTKAIRGGIPLCLPWFGSPADSPTRPGDGAGAHIAVDAALVRPARGRCPGLVFLRAAPYGRNFLALSPFVLRTP